jgi:hypothetical protein
VPRSLRASYVLGGLIVAVACLAPAAHVFATSVNLYVLNDFGTSGDQLYTINVADPVHMATSAISVGPAIQLDNQLAADYRSVTVLTDGRLVMETTSANRLSYWSSAGVFDSATGPFGGTQSWGVTALYDGRFLSHQDTSEQVAVYVNGQKTPSYTLTLKGPGGTTLPSLNFHYGQLAPREGGGFYAVADRFNAYVFDSVGDATHTTLNAIKAGSVSTGNTSRISPLAGGWGGTHSDYRWYRYNDSTYTGTMVNGPTGITAVDVAPLGEEYTAGLYNVAGGDSRILIWDNSTYSLLRNIDLGFALASGGYSDLAGPLTLPPTAGDPPATPEPLTLAMVGLSIIGLGRYTRRRLRAAA